ITADLTTAMKARDEGRTRALRMAKAALKNREIDKKAPLDDGEAGKVLQGLVKQREDAIEQYVKAGRQELADQDQADVEVYRQYLPQETTAGEIEAAVERAIASTGAAGAKDMGKAMKAALTELQALGKTVDGKRVNEAVRARLK